MFQQRCRLDMSTAIHYSSKMNRARTFSCTILRDQKNRIQQEKELCCLPIAAVIEASMPRGNTGARQDKQVITLLLSTQKTNTNLSSNIPFWTWTANSNSPESVLANKAYAHPHLAAAGWAPTTCNENKLWTKPSHLLLHHHHHHHHYKLPMLHDTNRVGSSDNYESSPKHSASTSTTTSISSSRQTSGGTSLTTSPAPAVMTRTPFSRAFSTISPACPSSCTPHISPEPLISCKRSKQHVDTIHTDVRCMHSSRE
jgi:hypothetical protein